MTDFRFDRRAFLKTTGSGALLAGIGSQQVTGSDDIAEGLTVYLGGTDDALYAIDGENGAEVWSFTDPTSSIESSPTVAEGIVYFGTNSGNVYAVDAATGDEVWKFNEPTSGVRSSPTIVDGNVYVGSVDSTLYAIDAASGAEEWTFDEPSGWIDSSPVVVDETVYVGAREGFGEGAVYAIDASAGEKVWSFTDVGGEVESSVALLDGVIYAGTTAGELFALDASSGTERWSVSDLVGEVQSPVVFDDSVYVVTTSAEIRAYDVNDESERWNESLAGVSVSGAAPTIADETLYIVSIDGDVYARDIDDGSDQWILTGPSRIQATPTVADGNVYFGSSDGNVYAVDIDSRGESWTAIGDTDAFESSATVVDDPVNGDSIDSRVRQGILGHTDAFAEEGSTEPGDPSDPVPAASITGKVTDSAGQPLGDIEISAENQDANEQLSTETDADGEFELELEPDTEYLIFIFDQFGLEQFEFEKFVKLDEEETLDIDIELLSKFEIFEAQKLGSDDIAGLAPRIDDLTTPIISEEDTVESEIQDVKAAIDNGDIDEELGEEALERMVLGEAVVTRTLEAVTDSTPLNFAGYEWSRNSLLPEDEMPDFDLLFQTSKGIVIGICEAFYSAKKIAKEALGEFADRIIDRILSAIGNFIRDLLSDFASVLDTAEDALTIGEMLLEIDDAADDAIDRLEDGATFGNVRDVIEDFAEPIADQIASSILAAIELLSINRQLDELNTTLSAQSLLQDPQFSNDIVTVADDTTTQLQITETQVNEAEEQMNPESDALEELVNLAADIAEAGLTDIPGLLTSIWNIVRDLVNVLSAGFNIGFGIVRTRQIYTGSADVVSDITETG